MDDAMAGDLARSVLDPGEALLWSEAAPSQPAAAIHIALAIIPLAAAAGLVWLGFLAWRRGAPAAGKFKTKILTVASFVGLGAATLAGLAAIVLLGAFAAVNGMKAANDGSAAYMITDRRAGFVYGPASSPYVEPLDLSLLRVVRAGESLRLGQPLGTELFGVILDPVFYDLADADRAADLLQRVAAATTTQPEVRTTPLPIDERARAAIAPALYAAERVIWAEPAAGRPGRIGAAATAVGGGLAALLFFIGALFSAPQYRLLLRTVLTPIGIGVALIALANAGWAVGAGSIAYALTNQRVLIVRTEPWLAVRSFPPFYFDATMQLSTTDAGVFSCRISSRSCQGVRLEGVRDPDAVATAIRAQFPLDDSAASAPAAPAP